MNKPKVSAVFVLEKGVNGEQSLSVYRPMHKMAIPEKDEPPVPVDRSSRRIYTRFVMHFLFILFLREIIEKNFFSFFCIILFFGIHQ